MVKIHKPKNDDEFLEDVAMIIFVAGFRYDLVAKRWPLMKKAFQNFSINKVAILNEKDVEKLMHDKNMIKNRMKIEAVIENAKLCKRIQQEHSTVLKAIQKIKNGYAENPLFNQSLEEFFVQFKRIGKVTSKWLASLHNAKGNHIEYKK